MNLLCIVIYDLITYYSKLPLNRTRLYRNDHLYGSECFPLERLFHRYCSLYNEIRLFRKKIQVPWTSIKRELTVYVGWIISKVQ